MTHSPLPLLQMTFLGAAHLAWHDGQPVERLTPKAFALFTYLAVTATQGQLHHTRDTLANLLWSEQANQQARTNLRYLLPELRKKMGAYLSITSQSIGFNQQQSYWLDVEALLTDLDVNLTALSMSTLQAAVDLYQGEFLAGFNIRDAPVFEAWVTLQRERLHQVTVQGLYTLAERHLTQGDSSAGIATVQRLLHLEPWHEAGHRLQMQFLAATGQRVAALAQYDLCRTLLAEELGVTPEAATTALYAQMRDGAYDKVTGDKVTGDKVTERELSGRKVTPSLSHAVIPSPPH
ncbi:MAG: BTAD domain-containing putative transcriptional regulator, partial [Caldilineaceae bacterium]